MGSIGSILNMVKEDGGEAATCSDPAEIAAAEKLILPAWKHSTTSCETYGEPRNGYRPKPSST